ncbi:MAG: TolC family protein [Gammaproteobacteria bacterium]|nr:TolC family protein [Gammaproteobacteria bacterium]
MTISNCYRLSVTGFLLLFIVGCTTVPKDGGLSKVEQLYTAQTGTKLKFPTRGIETSLSTDEVNDILSKPLALADAERLALEVNPSIKAKLANVGIAEADYAQAGRLENPGFTYERFSGEEYASSLIFDIGGLVLMPLKRQLEARRLEMARYNAAASVLDHLSATRRAWINAIAEKQQTAIAARVLESVETSNTMLRQMSALGHSSVLEAAQSEISLSEFRAALGRQRMAESMAREALIRQLGLWGEPARALKLPEFFPKLPDQLVEIESVEREAIERRLDVQMAKLNVEGMAKNFKLTKRNPFLSTIELGPSYEKAEGESELGYELEWRIPLFDAGGVQNKKAKFIFEQAQAQAQTMAIAAASNARESLAAYRTSWEIATHYRDQVLPLRERVSKENLLMYNGMLISVFDLLDDVRSAASIESSYVNAVRDFWLAETNLQQAMIGTSSAPMNFEGAGMIPAAEAEEGH